MKHLMLTTIAAVFFLLLSDINNVNAGGALAYKVVGDVVTIKDCKETASGALVIPATYDGKPVTSIGSWAFWNCANLSKVTIPDSVTSIGNFAFHSCSDLNSVTIGNSVTNIMAGAFYRCSRLASVMIPDSVISIDSGAFIECDSLTSIEAAKSNALYSSEDGVLFDKHKTELLVFPAGKSGHYTIPESVTSIGDRAFNYCRNLFSVAIPDSVTSIGGGAFESCISLANLTIPDSVTSIGNSAFNYCRDLSSVTISNSITTIAEGTFYTCINLTSVTVPDSVTNIGNSAFGWCINLTSINISDSVTSIDSDAFLGCSNLTSVTIPDGVTRISEGAFERCRALTSVKIPDSVTSIGEKAFYDCRSLTSITIPDSVVGIYNSAFEGCISLKRITFEGDSPFFWGANVFSNISDNAKIFINPDSIAFGETVEGLPVIIFEELTINTFGKSATLRRPFSQAAFPFSLNFKSILGLTYIIEASHDLKQWSEIGQVQAGGSSVEYIDWRAALFQKQYYRVKLFE